MKKPRTKRSANVVAVLIEVALVMVLGILFGATLMLTAEAIVSKVEARQDCTTELRECREMLEDMESKLRQMRQGLRP